MSIASELSRLQQAKSDLATSITNKGVTVPAATTIDGYAALVDQIQQGGGTLPYDAEIEYLECTGTQYIDTGIKPNDYPFVLKAKFRTGSGSGNYVLCGCCAYNSSNVYYRYVPFWDNSKEFRCCNNSGTYSASTAASFGNMPRNTIYEIISTITPSGVSLTYSASQSARSSTFAGWMSNSNITLTIMARNDTGTINAFEICRLYYITLIQNGVLVFDAIPVRVGTTGYLYDKVSGTLFGNAGTGNFVLGADKN